MSGELIRTNTAMAETATPDQELLAKFMVVLVRPGVGARKFNVPPGTTAADLLETAQVNLTNQEIQIAPAPEGRAKVDKSHVLQPDTVVFVVPKPKNA